VLSHEKRLRGPVSGHSEKFSSNNSLQPTWPADGGFAKVLVAVAGRVAELGVRRKRGRL
jgi:hypothetical protein